MRKVIVAAALVLTLTACQEEESLDARVRATTCDEYKRATIEEQREIATYVNDAVRRDYLTMSEALEYIDESVCRSYMDDEWLGHQSMSYWISVVSEPLDEDPDDG